MGFSQRVKARLPTVDERDALELNNPRHVAAKPQLLSRNAAITDASRVELNPNLRRCRRTEARKTAPGPCLMKLFKLVSQG
jgi:hypothetical protein